MHIRFAFPVSFKEEGDMWFLIKFVPWTDEDLSGGLDG